MFCRVLAGLPNTYCFTKSLGECLVVEQMDTLPVVVLRPSVGKYSINFFLTGRNIQTKRATE